MAPFLTQLVSKCQDSPQIDIARQIDIALQIYMALQIQRWPSKYIWPSRYIWPSKYRALQTNGCEEKKHRGQTQKTESRAHRHCTLPTKKLVVREYRIWKSGIWRVREYQNIKITKRERNEPQETPCTLPQDKEEEHWRDCRCAQWMYASTANT